MITLGISKAIFALISLLCFFYGVSNYRKYKNIKHGFHDNSIQKFVNFVYSDPEVFKKKALLYFCYGLSGMAALSTLIIFFDNSK